jgi:hypothetical protein
MTVKERLHQLVDALPESEAHAAERYLDYLREAATEGPLMRALRNVQLDDEPYTEAERAAVAEARKEKEKGIPHEEVKRMLGLA